VARLSSVCPLVWTLLLASAAGAFAQTEITPSGSAVTASTHDGNLPANTVDNSLSSRWSANGDGQWIRFDLGSTRTVAFVRVAAYQGNTRQSRFDLQVSSDGAAWTTVWSGSSSGSTTAEETYDFADRAGRYVRYLGHGNTVNAWNSVTEASIFAAAATEPTPTPMPTATPTPSPTPRATSTPTPSPTPRARVTPTPTATPTPGGGSVVNVTTGPELTAALANARPGQVIRLAAGSYTAIQRDSSIFKALVSGTASSPITLEGPSNAVLQGSSTGTGYAMHLNGASYWILRGFTVTNVGKGIMLDNAQRCLIDNVTVHNIGQEGVHFRTNSANNTIQNSRIYDTGRSSPDYGEAIYIGSAVSNWGRYTGGQPDRSDNVRAINNHLGPGVSAEHFDIKEGTTGCEIRGNTMDAAGMSGANFSDSYIDAKSNNCTIADNVGTLSGSSALLDGMQTHVQETGWGNGNVFSNNRLAVNNSAGYGFRIHTSSTGTRVCSNNTATGAGLGLANVPLASCN